MARPHTRALTKAFRADRIRSTTGKDKIEDEAVENAIEWTTLFRRNWEIYAEFYLGIGLKPFQREALHLMGVSDSFFFRAGRGVSKTFLSAIAAMCALCLYPNSWIVITASTVEQANKMVEDKIIKELINKLSPYLLYLYEKDFLKITKPNEGTTITNTLNNSTLKVMGPVSSSRGSRANFLFYDECRLLKKSDVDSIFEPMLYPRQPIYLDKQIYVKNPRWVAQSKTYFLTSSGYKFEWWYRTFTEYVTGYYTDKHIKYNIYAADIFTTLNNGLKTIGDIKRAKKNSTELNFRIEYLNEAVGENEDSFFSLAPFKKNQKLENAFMPPTDMEVLTGLDKGRNPPKDENEVRLVVVDFAFTNSTGTHKSDNTIMMCISGHWKKNHFERHVDYLETYPGGDGLGAALRIKKLRADYDADYVVIDQRSGGEVIYNKLTEPQDCEERGNNWDSHGLTLTDNRQYMDIPPAKQEDLVMRTVDPLAIKCIIPIIGTTEFNSMNWVSLKKQLEANTFRFLCPLETKRTLMEDSGEYFELTSEQYIDKLMPFNETEDLIDEAINLQTTIKMDKVILSERRNKKKDRIVVLSYANHVFDLIENAWNKQLFDYDLNIDDIQCVW